VHNMYGSLLNLTECPSGCGECDSDVNCTLCNRGQLPTDGECPEEKCDESCTYCDSEGVCQVCANPDHYTTNTEVCRNNCRYPWKVSSEDKDGSKHCGNCISP
jgi:hypothetical protein